jgi:HSP20 family protein
MILMTHEIVPRRSDSYSMTPFDFFEDFGRSFFDGFPSNLIKTDIHENDNEFLVEAELPGIPKENIQVTYENGVLTITGQHQTDHATEDEKGRLVRSERSLTSVRRQYLLENVKEDEIKASYAEGILKLTLPKDQGKQASKKLIPIE